MVFVIMMEKYLRSLHAYYQIFVIYWMKIETFLHRLCTMADWVCILYTLRFLPLRLTTNVDLILRLTTKVLWGLKMPTNSAQVVKYRLTEQQQLNHSMEITAYKHKPRLAFRKYTYAEHCNIKIYTTHTYTDT